MRAEYAVVGRGPTHGGHSEGGGSLTRQGRGPLRYLCKEHGTKIQSDRSHCEMDAIEVGDKAAQCRLGEREGGQMVGVTETEETPHISLICRCYGWG